MRSGSPLTQLVEFPSGLPDGNVAWELLDGRGTQLAVGYTAPAADAASAVLAVPAALNTLPAGQLSSPRELHWSYTVGGVSVTGTQRYRLEAFLPLGLSEDGVRRKLGVERHELEDEKIDLVAAYSRFRDTLGDAEMEFVETNGGYPEIVACDAIEATAALTLLPSLQISLAALQSSGTDQFKRDKIDWDRVETQLQRYVSEAYRVLTPTANPTADYGALLIAVVRPDPLIGEG